MKYYWLYLEPYVYVNTIGKQTLFYNTLNGFALESDHPEIVKLARRLCHSSNLYVVKLSEAQIEREPYAEVITSLRQQFMADLIDQSKVKNRPMQFMPILKNMRDIDYLRNALVRSPGEDILNYLDRVTIYITDQCQLDCTYCGQAHRQFLFCYRKPGGRKKELSIDKLSNLIHQFGTQRPHLNITGGDILSYSHLDELCLLLQKDFPETVFSLHLEQAVTNLKNVAFLTRHGFPLRIGMAAPFDAEKISTVRQIINENEGNCTWLLLVQGIDDVTAMEKIQELTRSDECVLQPFYNGNNYPFFRENVFSEKENVCEQCLSQKEIFARKKSNPGKFGCITILPGGEVYADINSRQLGSLEKDSIHELIFREMTNGKTWLNSRNKKKPCRSCLWNSLCPPLSNYESVIGQNDLCWKSEKA